MNINKFRLLQIIATIFFLVLHSVSFSSTREYKPVPVNKLHQSLSQQLTGDLYAAKSHRAELLTAQRQAQGKSNDANKRTQIDSAAQAISRVSLFSKEATGSFCGNATDRLSIVTKELKGQFISGLDHPSGKAYATMPVGCVHGVVKTYAAIFKGIAEFADELMDIKINIAPTLVVEVTPKSNNIPANSKRVIATAPVIDSTHTAMVTNPVKTVPFAKLASTKTVIPAVRKPEVLQVDKQVVTAKVDASQNRDSANSDDVTLKTDASTSEELSNIKTVDVEARVTKEIVVAENQQVTNSAATVTSSVAKVATPERVAKGKTVLVKAERVEMA